MCESCARDLFVCICALGSNDNFLIISQVCVSAIEHQSAGDEADLLFRPSIFLNTCHPLFPADVSRKDETPCTGEVGNLPVKPFSSEAPTTPFHLPTTLFSKKGLINSNRETRFGSFELSPGP